MASSLSVTDIRSNLDATRRRTDRMRRQIDEARLRLVQIEREPSTAAMLDALTHRHEFIVRAMEACERMGMFGQVGSFLPVLDKLELEIGVYAKRLGLC